MTEIPQILKQKDFCFIEVPTKSKKPVGDEWQKRGKTFDDPKLLKHLETGGNYGVMGGYGNLAGIDADEYELQKAIEESLPKTFKVQSGGKSDNEEHPEKVHYYYILDEPLKKTITLERGPKENVGHIRWTAGQLIGPGSIHENGEPYKIVQDIPIAKIKKGDLLAAVSPWLKKDKNISQTIEPSKEFEGLHIENIISLSRLKNKGGGKYQGPHPFHPSKTKWNFEVDINKGVWYCFNHECGGGALELLAIKEGVLDCGDVGQGCLRGQKFKEVLEVAQKEYGLKKPETEPKPEATEKTMQEVPTNKMISFSNFDKFFTGTHKHLHAFDLIDAELGLIGDDYYAIKKHLCYDVESQRQKTITFFVGRDGFDNRLHNLFVGGGGKGKGCVKKISKNAKSQAEISASRTNLEQLIGKIKKGKKGEADEEDRSIFGEKKLLMDEAQALLREDDKGSASIMHDLRIAMDTYGFNEVQKKQVDVSWLKYFPETRMTFFTHDIILPPVFFDSGTYRRMFAFELRPQQVPENVATMNLYCESRRNEIKEYIQMDALEVFDLTFEKDVIDVIAKWIMVWNRFALQHPNQRVRAIGKQVFFSVKNYFFRTIAILTISQAEAKVRKETAEIACFDCVQFLLKTFELYANKSMVTLSRDVWKTDSIHEAMLFEWLHYNKATSKESSNISIFWVQDQIQDYWGVTERQSRAIFNKLKKNGFIDCHKGQHDSVAWLAFEPELEGFVEFGEEELPSLEEFLRKKRAEIFGESGERGRVTPPLP